MIAFVMDPSVDIHERDSESGEQCPASDQLLAFAQGRLPAAVLARIDRHLSACDTCAESLRGLTDTETSAVSGFVADPPETETIHGESQVIHQRYRLQRLLGRGKFGSVFLARDLELDRDVAIKLPRRSAAGSAPHDIESLLREARAAARLQHPGIVAIYDAGRTDEGACFIAMEYVRGKTLRQLMDSEAISPERAASIIAQAADAIQFAHQQGIIHRDLKPANLLFDDQARVRVSDFGLALEEERQRDHVGDAAGTPAYMAPEQVRGESQWLDGRTDVWSLGAILYELLSGRRPFSGKREQLLEDILYRPPKPPRQIRSDIPAELERICLRCLAKDVAERYSNAADLAHDLSNWNRVRSGWRTVAVRLALLTAAVLLGVVLTLSLNNDRPDTSLNRRPPADAFDLKDAKPFVWHEMLSATPEQLVPQMWPHERWAFDEVQNTLWVDSPSWYLMATGRTGGDFFDVQTDITKNVLRGAAGIFLGFQAEPSEESLRRWKCHWIIVHSRSGEAINIERQTVLMDETRLGTVAFKTRLIGVLRVPKIALRSAQLVVSVRAGRVTDIRWQGQPLPELCDKALPKDETPPDNTGKLGVVNLSGATTFSTIRYMSHEANPK
jgi:serine/threonine protein kinase